MANRLTALGASATGHGHEANEDRWGSAGSLAWVIDGATRPAGTAGQTGGEYAQALSEALWTGALDDNFSPMGLAFNAIAETEHPTTGPDDPGAAAAMALIRRDGEFVEWYVLGDCSVVLPPPGPGLDPVVKTDNRIPAVATRLRKRYLEVKRRADKGGRFSARVAEALHTELVAAQAAARNAKGGYPIAAGDTNAAGFGYSGRARTDHPVVLLTDGMAGFAPAGWHDASMPGFEIDHIAQAYAEASHDNATIVVASSERTS